MNDTCVLRCPERRRRDTEQRADPGRSGDRRHLLFGLHRTIAPYPPICTRGAVLMSIRCGPSGPCDPWALEQVSGVFA